jgi:glycosyltransferase involved in cell wall biosynthesis
MAAVSASCRWKRSLTIPTSTSATRAPRVSVVIPTYNRARDLVRCLDSLVAQTYRDFEVLVCDDGSTDGSAAAVAAFEGRLDLRYDWQENSGGPAGPRNRGIRLARGEYVAFLDSDDWWLPEKLGASVQCLNAGFDLVHHDLYLVRHAGQRHFWRKASSRTLRSPIAQDLMENGAAIVNSSVVVRRELLVAIGGFSEDTMLAASEDYDAWLRIAHLTERFTRLERTLGFYWAGGGNISSPQKTIRNLQRLRELHFASNPRWRDGSIPSWQHYLLGRAHYRLGSHRLALGHLGKAVRGELPVLVRAKALITLAASFGLSLRAPGESKT